MQGQNATLIVIEYGASWPRWLSPAGSGNVAVVAQHYEGEPASLITQVASRLARVVKVGWSIRDVVLVANERSDVEASSARSLLSRALLMHLREVSGKSLTLSVASELGRRVSHSLLALAGTLETSARAASVSLCVRVGETTPFRSGPLSERMLAAS